MAEKSGSQQNPVKLREKISRSREMIGRDVEGLRYELDFPLKFRKAFQRNTAVWSGAALALGLLLALMRARTKKVYVGAAGKKVASPKKSLLESGALLGALKLGMTLIQPMVVSHFAKKGSKEGGEKGARQSRGW